MHRERQKKMEFFGGGLVVAVFGGAALLVRRKQLKEADELRGAVGRGVKVEGSYGCVVGQVQAAEGEPFESQWAHEMTVASSTRLVHRWMERTLKAKKQNNNNKREPQEVVYSDWETKEEVVGTPVKRMIPAIVLAESLDPQLGQVLEAVRIDAPVDRLPLVLRYSMTPDEAKSKGGGIVINNSAQSGAQILRSGTRETKDLGQVREELVLDLKAGPITIFGWVRRLPSGQMSISPNTQLPNQPWICNYEAPSLAIATREGSAETLRYVGLGLIGVGLALAAWGATRVFLSDQSTTTTSSSSPHI